MPKMYLVISINDPDQANAPVVTVDPETMNPNTDCWQMQYQGQSVDDFLFQYSSQDNTKGDKTYSIQFSLPDEYQFATSGSVGGREVTQGVVWDASFDVDDSVVKSQVKQAGRVLLIKAQKKNNTSWENLQFGFKFAVTNGSGQIQLSPDPRVIISGDGHLPN